MSNESRAPDCFFPEEVRALVISFKRIAKYNNELNRFGQRGSIAYQAIQKEANKWIKLLEMINSKRRVPTSSKIDYSFESVKKAVQGHSE